QHGVGGIGEREFLRRFPALDGAMVLHHGITTLLRIGDVSLIDLRTLRVRAIGEIKTAKSKTDERQLSITLSLIGDPMVKALRSNCDSAASDFPSMSASEQNRFERQLQRMKTTLK